MKILGQFKLQGINKSDTVEFSRQQALVAEALYDAMQHEAEQQELIAKRTRSHHREASEQGY